MSVTHRDPDLPTKLRAAALLAVGNRQRMGELLGVSPRTVARWIRAAAPELHLAAGTNQHSRAPKPVESPPVTSI